MTELLLIPSYLIFIAVANAKQYKRMLFLNIFSCSLCGLYLFLNEAYVSACVSTIAGMASLVQFCRPIKEARKNAPLRNGVATAFAAMAVGILYSRPSDIFPCLAFTINRLAEAQENPQVIRISLAIGGTLWASYAFYNGLYLFVGIELIATSFVMYTAYKNHNPEKLQPVPIRVRENIKR